MKQMTLKAKRAVVGGFRLQHPTLGGFVYYCLSGGKIL